MDSLTVFSSRNTLFFPRPKIIANKLRRSLKPTTKISTEGFTGLISDWGLELTGPIDSLPGAVRNETWVARTNEGRKVIKRYEEHLSFDQILHEHSILRHLERENFPSVRLVPDKAGKTILMKEGRYYALFDYLEGYVKFGEYIFVPDQFKQFIRAEGKVLAHLHTVLQSFTPRGANPFGFQPDTGERQQGLSGSVETLDQCVARYRATPDEQIHPTCKLLIDAAGSIRDRMQVIDQKLQENILERTIVHGDFRPNNLMVKPGYPLVVMDFELARSDYRLLDIISLLSTSSGFSKQPNDDPAMVEIMRAYQSVRPIPEEEYRALPLVLQSRKMFLLVSFWDRYYTTGESRWLKNARHNLQVLDWAIQNQSILENLYTHLR